MNVYKIVCSYPILPENIEDVSPADFTASLQFERKDAVDVYFDNYEDAAHMVEILKQTIYKEGYSLSIELVPILKHADMNSQFWFTCHAKMKKMSENMESKKDGT